MSLRQPPSLHDARRRALASEWIFRVITEGFGMMPRFTTQLDTRERWAVVSYVRALQRSQAVDYDALPADLRDELDHPRPKAEPVHHGHHGEHGEHGEHHVDSPESPESPRGQDVLPPAEKEDGR